MLPPGLLPGSRPPSLDEDERRERRLQEQRSFWQAYTAGLEFVVIVLVFGLGGWQTDRWLGLDRRFPLFLVLGMLLGLALATLRLQRKLDPRRRQPPED